MDKLLLIILIVALAFVMAQPGNVLGPNTPPHIMHLLTLGN